MGLDSLRAFLVVKWERMLDTLGVSLHTQDCYRSGKHELRQFKTVTLSNTDRFRKVQMKNPQSHRWVTLPLPKCTRDNKQNCARTYNVHKRHHNQPLSSRFQLVCVQYQPIGGKWAQEMLRTLTGKTHLVTHRFGFKTTRTQGRVSRVRER